ncbi:MAG: transposase [Aggregatilineales bacterium]
MRHFPGVDKQTLSRHLQSILQIQHIQIDTDYQRDALKALVQHMMEMDVRRQTAAARYERNQKRRVYRNGYRESIWHSIIGKITLNIPKLRQGSYYPTFLHAEKHLNNLIITAYLTGLDIDSVMTYFYRTGIMPCNLSDADEIAILLNDLTEKYQATLEKNHDKNITLRETVIDIDSMGRNVRRRILLAIGETTEGRQILIAHNVIHEADTPAYNEFVRTLAQRGTINGVDSISADAMGNLNPEKRRIKTTPITLFNHTLSYAA